MLDFDFNPFHDAIVCTGGDDGKVMIWGIPPGGLKETQSDPLVNMQGRFAPHQSSGAASQSHFHPPFLFGAFAHWHHQPVCNLQ